MTQTKFIIYGVGLLIVLGIGLAIRNSLWNDGYDTRTAEDTSSRLDQLTSTRETEQQSNAASTKVGEGTSAKITDIHVNTAQLLKEPSLHEPLVSNRCVVPVGLVRLHDASALSVGLSSISFGAGLPHDADSGFTCAQFLSVVVANYGDAHVWKSQVDGWQRWSVEQAAIMNDKR